MNVPEMIFAMLILVVSMMLAVSMIMVAFYAVQRMSELRGQRRVGRLMTGEHERLVRLTDAERTAEIRLLERKVFNS